MASPIYAYYRRSHRCDGRLEIHMRIGIRGAWRFLGLFDRHKVNREMLRHWGEA